MSAIQNEIMEKLKGLLLGISKENVFKLVGYIASFITLLTIIPHEIKPPVVAWTFSFTYIFFLFLSIWREFFISRQLRYAFVMGDFHRISHNIRDLRLKLWDILNSNSGNRFSEEFFLKEIISILTDMSSMFTLLTGTSCRATIKVVKKSGEKVYICTLARDEKSWSDLVHEEDKKRCEDNKDPLEKNSDFYFLYYKYGERGKRWFFSNDLTSLSNYSNSRINGVINKKNWNLPYVSTIVWPIQGKIEGSRYCLGFLCIDSPIKNVFVESSDGEVGSAVADMLFDVLYLYVAAYSNI